MQRDKQGALEAAGWKFGDAADFLAMTDEERQMLDLRVGAALAVKRQRQAMKLSQSQLGRRMKTSQPRIVKIEQAAKDVTLDQILRAYAAAGGQIALREVAGAPIGHPPSGRTNQARGGKNPKRVSGPSKVHIELFGGDKAP
jgi:transcriptional regulator with XRE-family HTH domain